MSDDTGIAWTDATWNPVRGCSKVSAGCANCYAESVAARFSGSFYRGGKLIDGPYSGLAGYVEGSPRWTGEVRLVPEVLDQPLRWRKPRKIFVNSMSDLFHERLSDEQIAAVFGAMAMARRHTFQVLTKRADRARDWFRWIDSPGAANLCREAAVRLGPDRPWHDDWGVDDASRTWPLPNVWLGVSVEDQRSADKRIPILLETPAAIRFVSYEPAIGPVDFRSWMWPTHERWPAQFKTPEQARAAGATVTRHRQALTLAGSRFLDWIIVGGESGPRARPFAVEWARATVEQCRDAGVACFVKQLGSDPRWCHECMGAGGSAPPPSYGFVPCPACDGNFTLFHDEPLPHGFRLRSTKGGDPSEWPEDLRVREFPVAL